MSQFNRVGKKLYFVVGAEFVECLLTRGEARDAREFNEIIVEGYLTNKQREKLQAQIDRVETSLEQSVGDEVI